MRLPLLNVGHLRRREGRSLEPTRSPRVEEITQAGQLGGVGGPRTEVKSGKQNVIAAPRRPCATRESSGSGLLNNPGNFRCRRRGICCRKGRLLAGDATGCRHLQHVRSSLFRSTGSKTELVSELVCAAFRCDLPLSFSFLRLMPKSAEHAKWLDLLLDSWSERRDLNSRPLVPQTSALTGLRYAPNGSDYRGWMSAVQPMRGSADAARSTAGGSSHVVSG